MPAMWKASSSHGRNIRDMEPTTKYVGWLLLGKRWGQRVDRLDVVFLQDYLGRNGVKNTEPRDCIPYHEKLRDKNQKRTLYFYALVWNLCGVSCTYNILCKKVLGHMDLFIYFFWLRWVECVNEPFPQLVRSIPVTMVLSCFFSTKLTAEIQLICKLRSSRGIMVTVI